MFSKRNSQTVMVGKVGVGGDNPIRIQSMTNTHTDDTEATINQIIQLADSGCEMVRMTVQGSREVKACEIIRNNLIKRNYNIPLIADIHFSSDIAVEVAEYVDKIRINPGNYADPRASFKNVAANESLDLIRIEEKLLPLINKCRNLKRSIRIGVNHGSLSDRLMSKYGNTPMGMVASAEEFINIFNKHNFHDLIISMKASNPIIMITAYKLLVKKMDEMRWNYPLHLGVTEAGEGEDGRIRSAMGIGALLLEGLGDTIRVSLTEDPCKEIEPCQMIKNAAEEYYRNGGIIDHYRKNPAEIIKLHYDMPFEETVIQASMDSGALFFNGIGNDVIISGPYQPLQIEGLTQSILQASRKKTTKTEFISCPGCGRTLFDLQKMTKIVKNRLANFPGLKIAVMGCIVNGPGEMADADYGFIGSGNDKVNLYAGQKCIARNLDIHNAIDRLLIEIEQKNKNQV